VTLGCFGWAECTLGGKLQHDDKDGGYRQRIIIRRVETGATPKPTEIWGKIICFLRVDTANINKLFSNRIV
jgi:hypothetical protein